MGLFRRRREEKARPEYVVSATPTELSVTYANVAYEEGQLTGDDFENHLRTVLSTSGEPQSIQLAAAYLGLLQADRGIYGEAEHYYRVALGGPDLTVKASTALNLANVYVQIGRPTDAETLYRSVMTTDSPDHSAKAAHNLGGLLIDLDRVEEGLSVLDGVVATNHPDESVGALLIIGIVRQRQGEKAAAQDALRRVVASGHPEFAATAEGYLTGPR